jgi:hypothetical protein
MSSNVRIQMPLGLKRKFWFSHFRENFRELFFEIYENSSNIIDAVWLGNVWIMFTKLGILY